MTDIFFTIALALNSLLANKIAPVLVRWASPFLKFKPFTCRECLTFWLTMAGGTALVFVHPSYMFGVAAILAAFVNFFYTKSIIQIYE